MLGVALPQGRRSVGAPKSSGGDDGYGDVGPGSDWLHHWNGHNGDVNTRTADIDTQWIVGNCAYWSSDWS